MAENLARHLLCVTIGLFNIPQVTVSEEKFLVTYYDDNNIITCCVCLGGILEESKKREKRKKFFNILAYETYPFCAEKFGFAN